MITLRLLVVTLSLVMFSGLFETQVVADEFDANWFYNSRSNRHRMLEGKPAPEITIASWHNGDPITLESLRGNVVVIDFWATWCGPCMRAIPKNVAMVNELADEDFVFIGVHDARRGHDKIPSTISSRNINYPIAVDSESKSASAYGVSFWPTYIVVDRQGVVRASGLKPTFVGEVVKKLLAEEAPAVASADVPKMHAQYHERANKGEPAMAELAKLFESEELPADLTLASNWMNSDALKLEDLEGKVVVLDFWATWCGPCIRAIPHANHLQERYKDEGLVFIGVCHPRGAEKMSQTAKDKGIEYPICADLEGKIIEAYAVDSFPDFYVIDRAGKLRLADCKNDKIEEVIRELLKEKAPRKAGAAQE